MFKPEQQKIYDGLNRIGHSLANFYADAVRMVDPSCTISSKANLIAHLAREIDGGLRDIFSPSEIKKNREILLSGNKNGHFASILTAVGKSDPENLLAKEWYSIAANFHRIAHRAEIHLSSKDTTEILELWGKYEKVLITIIGSFLNITNRLDVLLSQDIPQEGSLPALKNLLKDVKNESYFFSTLDKEAWLSPLNRHGFFDSASAPANLEQAVIPGYWPAIRYLLAISKKVQDEDKILLKQIIENIMDAYIKEAIDLHPYAITEIAQIIINMDNFSFGTSEKLFFEAYSKRTNDRSFTLVYGELSEKLTKKLLDVSDKEGLLNLLNYFFGFVTYEEAAISFSDEESGEPYVQKKPFVDEFYLGELGRLYGRQIIDFLGNDAIRVITSKLIEIDRLGAYSITSEGIPSIEPSSQSGYSNDWEDYLVYFIRDYAPNLKQEQKDQLIDEMLYSKVQVLQRLAIYFINRNFETFSDKWWGYTSSADNYTSVYIHEPYELLKKYSSQFTDDQFEKTINWIEAINPDSSYEVNGILWNASAYHIRRWLTSLSPASKKSRDLLNQKKQYYESKNNTQMPDYPEFDAYGTTHFGFVHPMSLEQFEELSVEEQVGFISQFQPENEFDSSEEGLAELLKYSVIAHPEKYLYRLYQFQPLHSLYANYLLSGFTEALQENKITDFLLPLNFIEAKFADETYSEEAIRKFDYKKWFASSISEFINTVIGKSEILKLAGDDADRIIDLLLKLLEREEFQDHDAQVQNGYVNHVLNSTQGRLYGALITTLRFWSKIANQSGKKIKWPDKVKEYFTKKLSDFDNTNKDFSIILGMELPFLLYLDKQWVADHFDEIFNSDNTAHFDYRIQTTFSRNYRPSFELYEFYRDHNLFVRALDYFTQETSVPEVIMIYAILEWIFWKGDPDGDSLIASILEKKNIEQIKQLIRISYQQKLDPEKAIYLWKRLLLIFDSTPELKDSYSILIWLFELQSKLDSRTFDLASKIVEKISVSGGDGYSILRHLCKIANTNIELAGELILKIYEKKLAGPLYENDLLNIVTELYRLGQKDLADNICIALGETGSLILKDIYNEFN